MMTFPSIVFASYSGGRRCALLVTDGPLPEIAFELWAYEIAIVLKNHEEACRDTGQRIGNPQGAMRALI